MYFDWSMVSLTENQLCRPAADANVIPHLSVMIVDHSVTDVVPEEQYERIYNSYNYIVNIS